MKTHLNYIFLVYVSCVFSLVVFFQETNAKSEIPNCKVLKLTTNKTHPEKSFKSRYNKGLIDPMTSEYAPPNINIRQTTKHPYIITESRLKEITKPLMYPYYDKGSRKNIGDYQTAIKSSTPIINKNLNFQLPFFGFRYNYTRVSLNGDLEFGDSQYPETYPLVFPLKDWPKKLDPAFIGIFLSKCKVGRLKTTDTDQRKPGVYFRVESNLRTRLDRMGVEIRERLKADIREGMIGTNHFDPKHAIIVTWKNISFAGGIARALYKTNTFQIVLATDEVYTYVMFNYLDLQWFSHTEAGGDVVNGDNGVPAFVGFNAGNGTRSFEYQPYSQNYVIRDLTTTGFGNGKPGRHYFRIDEPIYTGSCNKLDGYNVDFVFAPESGNMLGGTVVNITGPCFKPTDIVYCKFGDAPKVDGVVVDVNRAICIQPRLKTEGFVDLKVAIGTASFKYQGKYYVESPATATQKIYFDGMNYHKKAPSEIGINWEKLNLTMNEDSLLQMSLWGYKESDSIPTFLYITDLANDILNTGQYKIIPAEYKDRVNNEILDVHFGFIQIYLTESIWNGQIKINMSRMIWSRPIPIAWYFRPQWERKYGGNWSEQFCDRWIRKNTNRTSFLSELPDCPCTLEQALADKGRFMPDLDCDKDSNPTCFFNRGAVHCVKSGLPSLQGAEQQCCYDKNHYLMLSYDQQWGSFPRSCHNLGSEAPGKIPTLSQWYHDIAPRYVCCLWQDETSEGCETLRTELRPTQDCVSYQGPGVAGVYGDPHIITFDNLQYTFNGQGEFVLVRLENATNSIDIQGRFERMPVNPYGEAKATQLTSVVARGNTSTIIEVSLRPKEARWRYHLDVIANKKRVYFDQKALKYKHFPGVIVYTPSNIFNQSQVIVMFESGVGFAVVENNGQMAATVYLPQTYINKTRGLFGNWSLNVIDDLVPPDGTNIPVPTTSNDMERVHSDFGMKWMIDNSDNPLTGRALFIQEFGRTASYYNNRTFVPEFSMDIDVLIPENRSEHRYIANYFYGSSNPDCTIFDYAMTYDKLYLNTCLYHKAGIMQLKDTNRKKVISCGVLKTPRCGRKSTLLFTPGIKVKFECNEGFILTGDKSRTCKSNGKWNMPKYGYTQCSPINSSLLVE